MTLRLAIFDVDGTLVDSQADILAAMAEAFAAVDAPPPARETVLGIVGLSLPQAIARLAGDRPGAELAAMVEAYKSAYSDRRRAGTPSPLYPGIRPMLERLHGIETLLLAIATGKSRRGLDALLDSLDLRGRFVSTQCADDHPSKPHPAMLRAALAEAGVGPEAAVMVGDTSFDMEMARAARVTPIAVTWGYHPPEALGAAARTVADAAALEAAILEELEVAP